MSRGAVVYQCIHANEAIYHVLILLKTSRTAWREVAVIIVLMVGMIIIVVSIAIQK